MRNFIVSLCLSVICISTVYSNQIYGGDIRTEQIGNNQFKIILRCVFENDTSFINDGNIFDANNDSLFSTFSFSKDSSKNHLFSINSTINLSVVYFSAIVNLPNNANGYYLTVVTNPRSNSVNLNSS